MDCVKLYSNRNSNQCNTPQGRRVTRHIAHYSNVSSLSESDLAGDAAVPGPTRPGGAAGWQGPDAAGTQARNRSSQLGQYRSAGGVRVETADSHHVRDAAPHTVYVKDRLRH